MKPQIRRAAVLVATSAVLILTLAMVASAQVEPYSNAEVGGEVLTPKPETETPLPEVLAEEVLADEVDEVLAEEVLAETEDQDEVLVEVLAFTGLNTEILLTIGVALLLVGTAFLMHARAMRAHRNQP